MHNTHDTPTGGGSQPKLAAAGFTALALIALAFEHRLHLAPYLPWLLVLACPLMHLFHHGGHSHRHGKPEDKR